MRETPDDDRRVGRMRGSPDAERRGRFPIHGARVVLSSPDFSAAAAPVVAVVVDDASIEDVVDERRFTYEVRFAFGDGGGDGGGDGFRGGGGGAGAAGGGDAGAGAVATAEGAAAALTGGAGGAGAGSGGCKREVLL